MTTTIYSITLNGSTKPISNKDLNTQLNALIKAGEKANSSAWDYARAVATIIDGKLFEQDFKTQANFADFIGCSKVQITRYCKAYAFYENNVKEYSGGDKAIEKGFTVGKCHMLATLADANKFVEFMEYMATFNKGVKIEQVSERALRAYINAFNDSLNAESAGDDSAEEKAEAEADVKPEEMAEIRYAGSIYIIPLSVLKQYEKTVIDEETGKVIA